MPHHYRTYTCGRRRKKSRPAERAAARLGSAGCTRARCRARPHLGGRVRRLHLPSISVVALFVALLVIVRVVLDPSLHLDDDGGLRAALEGQLGSHLADGDGRVLERNRLGDVLCEDALDDRRVNGEAGRSVGRSVGERSDADVLG